MKVSVIVEDKQIVVDGIGLEVPADRWPSTPANIWAYQWDGSSGETETNVKGELNVVFSDISTVQPYIDIYTTIKAEVDAAAAASDAEAAAAAAAAEAAAEQFYTRIYLKS